MNSTEPVDTAEKKSVQQNSALWLSIAMNATERRQYEKTQRSYRVTYP